MKPIDKLLQIARSKTPKYICFTDCEGNSYRLEWPMFMIEYIMEVHATPSRETDFIPDNEVLGVIEQMETLPEGYRGILFYDILEELKERMFHVDT